MSKALIVLMVVALLSVGCTDNQFAFVVGGGFLLIFFINLFDIK